MQPTIDIEHLGFDAGAHLLVKHGLQQLAPGEALDVTGSGAGWDGQLTAWCRSQGHPCAALEVDGRRLVRVTRGGAEAGRWRAALHSGHADPRVEGAIAAQAKAQWGLAARGATVEAGSPAMQFRLDQKDDVWAERAADLYAQAAAAQWDPETAIDWNAEFTLPDMVEDAVVQVLTYMIENEVAALVVPARFLGQVHPHFREVQAVLAIQVADEARHIEVFTRRVRLKGREPGLSTAGGQSSLKTLLDEQDFSVAEFLLSVLGEGTFVSLLHFLHACAPDPVTRQIARLAARDEARHVAFGMTHLAARLEREPAFRTRLANAVQSRNDALAASSGLNEEVFDALILLAAGELTPAAIAAGYLRVQQLMVDMAEGRQSRLERLGFSKAEAQQLSALHTRNFM
ncbi:ferritin-like domain-containing protein [Massilia sp. DJPM01]|uniref:ferritin-like domain-containing protein n=1 Tax=Massilia sp. DJPM01 TaxID=3024404 RepID=UPI00259D9A56|nr:ferritin-like domain-containing protein [Massilia sp. DJPM01]MDM5177441.1 ferritin-like domain-containing protein [Massilia sp. DJPM01]